MSATALHLENWVLPCRSAVNRKLQDRKKTFSIYMIAIASRTPTFWGDNELAKVDFQLRRLVWGFSRVGICECLTYFALYFAVLATFRRRPMALALYFPDIFWKMLWKIDGPSGKP